MPIPVVDQVQRTIPPADSRRAQSEFVRARSAILRPPNGAAIIGPTGRTMRIPLPGPTDLPRAAALPAPSDPMTPDWGARIPGGGAQLVPGASDVPDDRWLLPPGQDPDTFVPPGSENGNGMPTWAMPVATAAGGLALGLAIVYFVMR